MIARPRGRRVLVAGAAALLPLALSAMAVAQVSVGNYELSFRALLGGGESTGGNYEVQGVVGQPLVGASTGGAYTVSSGFLAAATDQEFFRFLPFIAKDGIN